MPARLVEGMMQVVEDQHHRPRPVAEFVDDRGEGRARRKAARHSLRFPFLPVAAHREQQIFDEALEVAVVAFERQPRSEEHTSELQSLMRISYAVFCLTKKN